MAYSNAWNQPSGRQPPSTRLIGSSARSIDRRRRSAAFACPAILRIERYGQTISEPCRAFRRKLYNNFNYSSKSVNETRSTSSLAHPGVDGGILRRPWGLETQTASACGALDDVHVAVQDRAAVRASPCARKVQKQCRHLDRHTTRWTDWLRTTVGISQDIVAARPQRHAGKFRQGPRSITSPKAGIGLALGQGRSTQAARPQATPPCGRSRSTRSKVDAADRVPLLVVEGRVGHRTKAIEDSKSSQSFLLEGGGGGGGGGGVFSSLPPFSIPTCCSWARRHTEASRPSRQSEWRGPTNPSRRG